MRFELGVLFGSFREKIYCINHPSLARATSNMSRARLIVDGAQSAIKEDLDARLRKHPDLYVSVECGVEPSSNSRYCPLETALWALCRVAKFSYAQCIRGSCLTCYRIFQAFIGKYTTRNSNKTVVVVVVVVMETENREQPKKRSKRTEGAETSVRNEEKDEERRRHKKEMRQKALKDGEMDDKSRHRTKAMRHREKMIERLAALRLDENGEKLDNYSHFKYPVREWMIALPGVSEQIVVNPFVTLIGIVLLWGHWLERRYVVKEACRLCFIPNSNVLDVLLFLNSGSGRLHDRTGGIGDASCRSVLLADQQ
jgi:hypothetical protein